MPHGVDTELEQRLLAMREGLLIIALRALGAADAEDAVQETFARALLVLRTGEPPTYAPLEAWVHGIISHVISDTRRRQARLVDLPAEDHAPAPGAHALDALVRAEEVEAVTRALAALPGADRELLRRCFDAGERVADIARTTGEPASRIRKRKSRALDRMREFLGWARPEAGHASDPPTIVE